MPKISLLYPICLIYIMSSMYYIMYRRYFVKLDGKFSKIITVFLDRPCHGIFQNWAPRGHVEKCLYHGHFQQELSHGGHDSGYVNMVYNRWINLLHGVISIDLDYIIEHSLRDRWISWSSNQSLRNITNDHHNPQKAQMFNYKSVHFHLSVPTARDCF